VSYQLECIKFETSSVTSCASNFLLNNLITVKVSYWLQNGYMS